MKVTTTASPGITRYDIMLDPSDELCWRCHWANIYLDHKHYVLLANTDAGNFVGEWNPTPSSESFKHLMARVWEDYFLGKVGAGQEFLFDETKAAMLEKAREDEWEEFYIEWLEDIEECGEELFIYRLNDIKTDICYEDIPIKQQRPAGARAFGAVFTQILQPVLRQEVEQEGKTNTLHETKEIANEENT